jgi:6-phosphofructokinase
MVILRQPMNCWIESFSQTLVMRNSRYAVLTSGGDAPGMNAALRAVVGTGLNYGVETLGVQCGYKGLLEANFSPLSARDVGGIIQQGGTILGSGRCDEFETPDGIQKAVSAVFNSYKLESYFKKHQERLGFDLRVITLGHIQRGGCPTAFDRLIGTRFGAAAVECLHRESHGVLVGLQKNAITSTPLLIVVGRRKGPDQSLFRLAEMLAI